MNLPPEAYGCLTLAADYERRLKHLWKKGSVYKQKIAKDKYQKKIARLVNKAVAYLDGRGVDINRLTEELLADAKETAAEDAQRVVQGRIPRWP